MATKYKEDRFCVDKKIKPSHRKINPQLSFGNGVAPLLF